MFLKRKANMTKTKRPQAAVATRIVPENRWLHRNQLEVGMYVSELDRPWTETRFMFQGFTIDTQKMLEAVQESCEYACVQTEKLAVVSSNSTHRLVGASRL